MNTIRAVVFDYGHTFLDFAPAEDRLLHCYEEVRRLLEARAYQELPEAANFVAALSKRVSSMVVESYERGELEELDIVSLFNKAFQALGLSLPTELVRQIVEMEHRALAERLAVPAENLQVLPTLQSRGLKLGLVSNAHFLPDMMWHDIERLGIAQYLDDAVFSAQIGVRKPHPAIFMKVLDRLSVSPREAVFVGDRLYDDIGGAQRLGMLGVLTHQFRQEEIEGSSIKPDLVVERLSEVVPYVLERLPAESIG